jgi:CheY-specific phosphatase CheX
MISNLWFELLVGNVKESTHNFFNSMCPCALMDGENKVLNEKELAELSESFEVVGVITFKGQWDGFLSVHVHSALAETITKKLLMVDQVESESDVDDAVGEMTNIISGGLKTSIEENGLYFDISCPTVYRKKICPAFNPSSGKPWPR